MFSDFSGALAPPCTCTFHSRRAPVSPLRSFRLIALFAAIAGTLYCGDGGVTVPSEGLPSDITVLTGNGQTGVVGQPLSDSLAVRLTDSKDRPVQGQRIQFTVMTGGSAALLQPEITTTDADGTARAQWVLGGVAGEQRVEASVISRGSLTAEFTATAAAQVPDTVFAVEGQGQTGIVNGRLTDSLVVVVSDLFGNPLAGQTVTWRVPPGQGSVSSETTLTGDDGRAAVARILGPGAGAQSARASSGPLTGQVVVFTHTAISGHAVDLVKLSPDPQTAPAGSRLADSLVVQAQDANGNGVPGESITWLASAGGNAAPTFSTTDAEGKAFTYWRLSSAAGANTLTAAGFGTSIQYHATGISSDPDTLRALSPTGFTATAGQPVGPAQRPSVRVLDAQGNAVQGVTVTFTVTSGGGTIGDVNGSGTSVAIATDASGNATVTSWTLGPALGINSVSAAANHSGGGPLAGSPVSFMATAQAGAAATLVFRQQPGNAVAGTAITPAVTVVVEDQNGNPITSSAITVSLSFGNNPGSGTLSGTTSATPVNGVVTFSNLSVDRVGAGYTLVARAAGLTDVSSAQFDVTPGSANRLVFLNQPTGVVAGQTMVPPLQVVVQDAVGNTVTSSSDSITLSLNPASGGLGGTIATRAVNGVATFSQLTVGVAGNGYTISAFAPLAPLVSASTAAFDVAPGTPPVLHLVFTVQPSNTDRGKKFKPNVRVSIQDENNHVVASATNSITLALGNNPLGLATLNGTLTRAAERGVAEFDSVTVTGLTLFNNLTLVANSTGITSAESSPFDVR